MTKGRRPAPYVKKFMTWHRTGHNSLQPYWHVTEPSRHCSIGQGSRGSVQGSATSLHRARRYPAQVRRSHGFCAGGSRIVVQNPAPPPVRPQKAQVLCRRHRHRTRASCRSCVIVPGRYALPSCSSLRWYAAAMILAAPSRPNTERSTTRSLSVYMSHLPLL